MITKLLLKSFFCLLLLIPCATLAQEEDDSSVIAIDTTKKLHVGIFIGAHFANKYTASLYDGYGFDADGIRNDFTNSFMNRYMSYYGGKTYDPSSPVNSGTVTGTDLVAQTLNVAPGDWSFSQSDMPFNLTYNMTYLVGFNGSYNFNKTSALILNINGTKLTVNGKFTIATTNTATGSPNTTYLRQGTITGGEQRLMFQLGYQKVFTKHDKFNFFAEAGFNVVMSKFMQNQALIENAIAGGAPLVMDLGGIYSNPNYIYIKAQLTGVGYGFFTGVGLHLTINPKYTIQALYNPSFDRINIGDAPKFKMQNGFGLRFYYNL